MQHVGGRENHIRGFVGRREVKKPLGRSRWRWEDNFEKGISRNGIES
jgi:hypothetical protein